METTQTPKKFITKRSIKKRTKARVSRIDKEFADGFDIVDQFKNTVTIFGSARFDENHKHYKLARELSKELSKAGYVTVTGGGGGIMEAGNRGAYENGGETFGFNISLPHEQVLNPYTTGNMAFHYFFARKVILAYGAKAYVYFPGGYGTLDELFEIVTLIQTNKIPKAPVVLMGTEFWQPLDDFIKKVLRDEAETISPGDENLYVITDSIEEAVKTINDHLPVDEE